MDLREKAEELRVYAEYDGTEVGEMLQALIRFAYYEEYTSSEMQAALAKEVEAQSKYYKEHFKIVEIEETFTRKITTLEEKGI